MKRNKRHKQEEDEEQKQTKKTPWNEEFEMTDERMASEDKTDSSALCSQVHGLLTTTT